MPVDWKAAYDLSRTTAVLDGTLHKLFGAGVLVVGAIVSLVLRFGYHEPVGALVFAVPAAVFGVRQILRGARAGAPPHVVAGRVTFVQSARSSSDGSDGWSVTLDVRDAFRVLADGTTVPLPNLRGSRRYACTDVLFNQLSRGDEVSLLCLASADVVARVDDLPRSVTP
jgi:hypothetical protein